MKCPSIACLWPSSPPSHLITSSLTLPSPPSLFTGAADGSIIFWPLNLNLHDLNSLQPLSILCGHSSPITALSLLSDDSSLVSASSDGVLCVWAPGSNRCRRRRHLPPWAGSPSLIRPLPSSANRHLCVAARAGQVSTVLVIDSSTLTVIRTLAHGGLGIGVVRSMVLVGKEAILVDEYGKVLPLKLDKESDQDSESECSRPSLVLEEGSSDGAPRDVVISQDGKFAALIFETRCVFKLVADGEEIGDVSYEKNLQHPIGGIFLDDELGTTVEKFVVWCVSGAAVVYSISSLDGAFRFESLSEIPALETLLDERSTIQFCQFKASLVRLGSLCFSLGDSLLWKPHVSMWSVPQRTSGSSSSSSMLICQDGFFSCPIEEKEGPDKSFQERFIQSAQNGGGSKNGVGLDERIVSSSVVLSEDLYAPYSVIYGFYNGDIEVVQFLSLFPDVNSPPKSQEHHSNSCTLERFLLGHTGAVLCFAARCIVINSTDQRVCRVLVSGSTDCTVRIWDLDSGNVLSVLHHHVAPVKQIILPPPWTDRPWNNCFLTVGEDSCVALVSLETLRVERMFPGHPIYPSTVAWDSTRGYVACLCRNISSSSSSSSDSGSVLYLWDVKSGARERVIRGTASHSMFDHFCRGISINSITGNILGGCTSASSLLLPLIDDPDLAQARVRRNDKGKATMPTAGISHMRSKDLPGMGKGKLPMQSVGHNSHSAENSSTMHVSLPKVHRNTMHPVKSSCPFPGIATLEFDLSSLMVMHFAQSCDKQVTSHVIEHDVKEPTLLQDATNNNSNVKGIESPRIKDTLEECLLRFSLCFLHLWDVDKELDKLLVEEMNVCKPDGFYISSGVLGDRGSMTLMFPGLHATLELWKSSSEFCAMRSLVIVSLAQRMISLSHSSTTASSALAAFYTRNFAEKVPDIKPPLLQLLVSFWQDPSEHVRMAARSLFHCAAPRAIPHSLCGQKTVQLESSLQVFDEHDLSDKGYSSMNIDMGTERPKEIVSSAELEKSSMLSWLESLEIHEWISWIEGTIQDAMASHIVVAAALVVWYPSIVKDDLARLVIDQLIKLVMSMNNRYSSTAAELLAEGMESTWAAFLGPDIPRLVGDIFFQIECLTSTPANDTKEKPALAVNMREALVEILLPSLAMADIAGFLNVVEGQIWATSSDSPVHLVSLKTLIRAVRGSPKPMAPYIDKVVNYVLQTMDPGNLVMRKACRSSSMTALREITHVFPMVGMNESSTRLAVGDAIGDIRSVIIRVYDVESVTKIKILDASGPIGLPNFLEGASKTKMATAISALSFSPDGEGLVAFSENGLMIRWWSLGIGWREKLSRNLVPVQCTKLIFVPPWEGFSPSSSRSSIMASIFGNDKRQNSQDSPRELDDADSLKLLLRNLDLSYRLQWVGGRNVLLTRHSEELGTFPL